MEIQPEELIKNPLLNDSNVQQLVSNMQQRFAELDGYIKQQEVEPDILLDYSDTALHSFMELKTALELLLGDGEYFTEQQMGLMRYTVGIEQDDESGKMQ